MENPTSPICYCKPCIKLGSKGIISISSSNPMKEINEHIETHHQHLLLLEKNSILRENKINFVVKKTFNQNRWTFTIEKEFNHNEEVNYENATNNYESDKKSAHDQKTIQAIADKMDTSENCQKGNVNMSETNNFCQEMVANSSFGNETLKFNPRTDRLSRIRRLRCHQLSEKFKVSRKMPCRICKVELYLGKNLGRTAHIITQHIITHHLKKPIYICRLCKKPCKSYHQLTDHFLSQHQTNKVKGKYEDDSNKFHEEIMSSLAECFNWNDKLESDKIKLSEARDKISVAASFDKSDGLIFQRRNLCKRFAKKFTNGNTIQCRLCKNLVYHSFKVVNSSLRLTDHAIKHVSKPIYDCHICQKVCNSYANLNRHSKLYHEKEITKEENENRLFLHHEKILAKISECFDWSDQMKENGERSNQVKIDNYDTSELRFIRHAYCDRLIKNYGKSRKIVCQVCSKLVDTSSRRLTDHICIHLKKSFHHCRLCSKSFLRKLSLFRHLKNIHKISANVNQYEDLSDKYHDQIMKMLSKCFDNTSSRGMKKDVDKVLVVEEIAQEATTARPKENSVKEEKKLPLAPIFLKK